MSDRLKTIREAGKTPPEPSKIKVATREIKKTRPLTAPEVARILGVGENTVRRIPKNQLPFRKSKGGHRRYTIGAVKRYEEIWKSAEAETIHPGPRDQTLTP